MINKKKTIVFVTHYEKLYGANLSMLNLIEALNHHYNFIVLVPQKGEVCNKLKKMGIYYIISGHKTWVRMQKPNSNWLTIKVKIKSIFNNIFNYFNTIRVTNKLKNTNLSLVHTNSSTTSFGARLAYRLKIPHIWHFREFLEEDYHLCFNKGRKKALNFVDKNSDKVIFISKILRDKYRNYIEKPKIEIVYNGLPIKRLRGNIKLKERCAENEIVFVGSISEKKGQIIAIKAINYIKINNPSLFKDIKLYIIGDGDIAYLNYLKQYISDNDLSTNVKLLGYLDENNIVEIRKNAKIALICSEFEAFGRVVVEAMLNKNIVIGSNSGAIPEIIQDGYNGFLYTSKNYEELANIIMYIISNNNKLNYILQNAYEDALKNYSISNTAKKMKQIYDETIESV